MRVASAKALSDARGHVEQTCEHESYDVIRSIGDEFLLLADVVSASPKLAEALTSTIRSQADKHKLIDKLMADRTGTVGYPVVIEALKILSDHSWSKAADFLHTLEELSLYTLLYAAKQTNELDTIQRELFRVETVLQTQRQLRHALTSPSRGLDDRLRLLNKVFAATVSELTRVLLTRTIAHTLSGRLLATVRDLRIRTAHAQGKELAVVHVAQPLTAQQEHRLHTILQQKYGCPVHIDTEVDPSLIGGLRIRTGADLYEGTLSASLQQVKARLA